MTFPVNVHIMDNMKNTDTGTIIAVCALMTVLFGIIQLSVWPIKKDISKIEIRMDKLEAGQAKLSEDMAELKQLFYDFKNHSHNSPKQAKK